MLTGQLPFNGDYDQAIIYSLFNEEPKQISGLVNGVPSDLEKIVNRCLSKLPAERYQQVNDLKTDLEELTQKPEIIQSIKHAVKTPSNHKLRYYILGSFFVLLVVIAGLVL